jgi:hypothetical protein
MIGVAENVRAFLSPETNHRDSYRSSYLSTPLRHRQPSAMHLAGEKLLLVEKLITEGDLDRN